MHRGSSVSSNWKEMYFQKDTTVVLKRTSDDIILGKRIVVFPASNAALWLYESQRILVVTPKGVRGSKD